MKVQAAFDKERSSENYFSSSFEIMGNMEISLGYDPSCVCYTVLRHGLESFGNNKKHVHGYGLLGPEGGDGGGRIIASGSPE